MPLDFWAEFNDAMRAAAGDDFVLLEQTFYDQDLQPLKRMQTLEIGELGGRMLGLRMRMMDLEKPDSFTEIAYTEAEIAADVQEEVTLTLE